MTPPSAKPGAGRRAIIVSPASVGGLGDQAMLDVAAMELANRLGYATSILPNPTKVRAPIERRATGGLGGKLGMIFAAMRAKRAIVIGADIIDGRYDADGMLKRLRFAEIAARTGAKARVIGCSFSPNPNPKLTTYLKAAKWLEILARDPLSQNRMQNALERDIELVADSAFLMKPEARADTARAAIDWIKAEQARGQTVMGLNASGHVFSQFAPDTLRNFAGFVADWARANPDISILVLAHDTRPGKAGDVGSCDVLNDVTRAAIADRVHYVREGIAAWDVKEIAGHLDMSFLCRMHFAIACLGRGVPPLSLVSMGKFEGLMGHFGVEGLTLDPETANDGARVAEALDALKSRAPALRAQIAAALPNVEGLSARNYADF